MRGDINQLQATGGFLDIAPRGTAFQSSLSRWSKPDDASHALRPHRHEYAFHTDHDPQPWWHLKLDKAYPVAYVVIQNRRNPKYLDVCKGLEITISDGQKWYNLTRSDIPFGYEPHSPPLVIPVEGIPVRELKISGIRAGYLHLSRVQLFCPREAIYPPRPLAIVSNRPDGLGERLKAMMNAMVAADRLDTEFRFIWPEFDPGLQAFHAIMPREDMFTEGFIARYGCDPEEFAPDTTAPLSHASLNSAQALNIPPDLKALFVHQGPLKGQAPHLECLTTANEKMAEAFARIEFSAPLERARLLAETCPLPANTVALHLRAGDIIYGRCRLMGRFTHKVVSYPIAIALIQHLQKQKKSVLIFGQDAELSAYLKDQYKVLLASDTAEAQDFSAAQQALFEICLMSRCSEILAGQSGFAEAAAQIGNRHILDPVHVFDGRKSARILLKTLKKLSRNRHISHYQHAFAAWSAIHMHDARLSSRERDFLFKLARTYDPDNHYYRFRKACELYKRKKYAEADDLLISGLLSNAGSEWSLFRIFSKVWPEGGTSASPYLPLFETAANRGYPGASLAAACIASALKDESKAEFFKKRFLSQRPVSMALLDRRLS